MRLGGAPTEVAYEVAQKNGVYSPQNAKYKAMVKMEQEGCKKARSSINGPAPRGGSRDFINRFGIANVHN